MLLLRLPLSRRRRIPLLPAMSHFSLLPPRPGAAPGRGTPPRSAFLVSAWRRMAYALMAGIALWALTGWALDWWPR